MKVSELKKMVSEMNDNDDIFVLIYEKSEFDFDEDDECWLSPEKWALIVSELEQSNATNSLWADVHCAVVDYCEPHPDYSKNEERNNA